MYALDLSMRKKLFRALDLENLLGLPCHNLTNLEDHCKESDIDVVIIASIFIVAKKIINLQTLTKCH